MLVVGNMHLHEDTYKKAIKIIDQKEKKRKKNGNGVRLTQWTLAKKLY